METNTVKIMSHKGIISENNKETYNFGLVGNRNERQLMNKCSHHVNSCRIYILMDFSHGGKVIFNIVEVGGCHASC